MAGGQSHGGRHVSRAATLTGSRLGVSSACWTTTPEASRRDGLCCAQAYYPAYVRVPGSEVSPR